MSPEQKDNPDAVDGRSDIYSLGVVLYELATGTKLSADGHDPPSRVSERADPRLDTLIEKCLKTNPDLRYQTAEQLLEDIQRLRAELLQEPPCPACGVVNPVRAKACHDCGRDLSAFFDQCPDCRVENRADVQHCLKCGVNLQQRRIEIQAEIDEEFEKAFRLLYVENFREAQQLLRSILQHQGKVFHDSRMRAVALMKTIDAGQRRMSKVRFMQGKQLFDASQIRAAITVWEEIKPSTDQVEALIEAARRNLADAERIRRTRRGFNILLLIVGALALFTGIVVALMLTAGS